MFEHVLRHSMVLWFRNLLIGLLSLCAFEMTQAQVTSAIDTTQIRIVEEINLTIEAVADTTALVLFPEGKTFGSLEVIDSYKIDTALADSKYRLIKRYGLTQFDSGHYTLPALRVMIGDRAFNTDSVAIEVLDVPVDTTQQKMFDIKPAIEVNRPPFDWMLLLYWVAPILVVIGLVWFFLRRKKLKEAREKQLPPYEEAMVALQQLDASNLLKDEKEKEYYSSLTEIVKRYLDREVDDRALESTSDELIERLLLHKDAGHFKFDQETIRKLDAILKRADLVKFAKMRQDFVQAQADRSSVEAIINETKEALPEPTEEELRQNEAYLELLAKRKKRRQWAYGISGAIGVLLVAALVYGSITGFDNLRDRIFGNEMRSLAEGRWYKSEYGTPAVIVETPEVLKRILLIPQDSLQPSPKNEATFEAGNLKEPFYVRVTTTKLSQQVEGQQIDLNHALDQALNALEAQGAKNMIVKREDFETEKGIKGLKAYGEFHVLVSENKVLKEKSSYDLLIFAQEGGLQTVLLVYQDDGVYAEQVKNRILDSVELEVTNEGTKKES